MKKLMAKRMFFTWSCILGRARKLPPMYQTVLAHVKICQQENGCSFGPMS